jgi:hypothetical protein
MIVSAYQPFFAPFPGFFAKALRSDVLVIMDAVQFPRGTTWLTRNRFKNDQGTLWMTIPVWKKGLGLQKINEVRICHKGRWVNKHMASITSAYANAPFLKEHLGLLENIFSQKFEKLIDLNLEIIRHMNTYLKISARVMLLSQLGVEANEPQLSVGICRQLGASQFLAQSSAKKYLDEEAFGRAGIALKFFKPRPSVYPQLWGPFISNLSTFDLLFNCGPKSRDMLRACAKIIS